MENKNRNNRASLLILVVLAFGINYSFAQNNALNFDGVNDKVDISDSPCLNFSVTSKFSIEAWFKTTSSGYRIIVSKRYDMNPFTGLELMLNNGSLDFSICGMLAGNSLKAMTVNTFNDGNWHHGVAVYNGIPNANNIDLYVDGILQTKTTPLNNLSGVITTTDLVTIASRQGVTAYNFIGDLDEIRIWNKALCAQEIVAKKNCHLIGNEYGLVAYYTFNQGIAAANNSSLTTLSDLTGYNNTGTLTGFALNNSSSNWITSGANVNGNCAPFGPLSVSGNTVLCIGSTFSTNLNASGAVTYTWNTNSNAANIIVTPTINTNYTVVATDANLCITSKTIAVSLNPLPIVTAVSNTSLLCRGSSAILSANGASTYTWSTSSNSNSIAISPSVTTTYTLSGTSSIGCTNSSVFTQSVTNCNGIKETINAQVFSISVLPNPSNGNFKITCDLDVKIKLVNELGMIIKTIELNDTNGRTEQVSSLNSGVYFMISENGSLHKKLIVMN